MNKLIFMALILFFATTGQAADFTLTFEWTPNTDTDATVTDYVLYHRVVGQEYNFEVPVKTIPCTYSYGECLTDPATPEGKCTTDHVLTIQDGERATNFFVMRAEGIGDNDQALESENSNQVFISLPPGLGITFKTDMSGNLRLTPDPNGNLTFSY